MHPVLPFALFTLIGAPILGRLAWLGMETLHAGDHRAAAIGLSLAVSAAILAVNIWLLRRAVAGGLAQPGPAILWGITIVTFGLTIGTGFFSPVNLLSALVARG